MYYTVAPPKKKITATFAFSSISSPPWKMSLSRFPVRTLPSEGEPSRGLETLSSSPTPVLYPRRLSHNTLGRPRGTAPAPAPYPDSVLASGSAAASASDAFARGIEDELTRLRDENANLKVENSGLQGRVYGIEYVPPSRTTFTLFTTILGPPAMIYLKNFVQRSTPQELRSTISHNAPLPRTPKQTGSHFIQSKKTTRILVTGAANLG